jgi:hypothetical protein
MVREARPEGFEKIIADAIDSVPPARRRSTNLYLNTQVYEAGVLIGPAIQKIRTSRPSILVFVDEHPRANFGHDCRYRFYDAETQRFFEEKAARFPPYVDRIASTYVAIHEPVGPKDREIPRA